MGSTHVVEQPIFSIVPLILTFDFDSILGSFFNFWGLNGLFLWFGKGPNTVLGSTHVVEQPIFTIVPLILTFDFDSILGLFFTFGALIG